MNNSKDIFMSNPDFKVRIMASDGGKMQTLVIFFSVTFEGVLINPVKMSQRK